MTDVLLVNPKSIDVLPSYLPYGLLYLAAYTRKSGFETKIYDTNTEEKDFVACLQKENPKIVGVSILSGPCLTDAVEKAKIVRRTLPQSNIVFGGIHTTLFPREVLAKDYVDFIIMNEGEYPLVELAELLINGKGRPTEIKNLGYKKDQELFLNPIRPFVNLNDLPLPAWDLLPIEKYVHRKFYASRVLTLHTSRGCPWSCAYCYNQAVNFRRWRGMSAERIIEQIEYLRSHYQISGFQFYDDEFDVNVARVIEFCRLLSEKNIKVKWGHYSRTNVADEKRYRLEKEAGCALVEFGVESGSTRLLKMLKKQQTINQIKKAFSICRKVGLKAGAMFMIGLPTETEKEMMMTKKLVDLLPAFQTICTIYHPYPGSELYNYCLKHKLYQPPEELEKQGPYFNLGNTRINVSRIKTKELNRIYQSYAFNNVLQEIKLCLSDHNFGLLWSHVKSRFNLKNLAGMFLGMKNYYLSRSCQKHC